MAMEKQQVWTQNDHYLSDSKGRFQTMLLKQLYGDSLGSLAADPSVVNGLNSLNALGLGLTAEDIEAMVARKRQKTMEQDEGLIELIAGALAYYKVGRGSV